MESDILYKINKEDKQKIQKLLTVCFAHDKLYETLIPDEDTRKRLVPELMKCDVEEFFADCDIFADSEDIHGAIIVSDETEDYNPIKEYLTEVLAGIKTDSYVIKEDPSLKTLQNFIHGRDYLNETWVDQLHQDRRLHIIYLAVDPDMQHHGIADKLMGAILSYADEHNLMISLETHNEANVDMYKHYGFKVFGVINKVFDQVELKQYCMIRELG